MIRKLITLTAAVVAGIYLTSEEGKLVRNSLRERKKIFEPIVKSLITQANDLISGTEKIDSDEVRANIDLLANQAKEALGKINLEKTFDTVKDAINVASKKITAAANEFEKDKRRSYKKTNHGSTKKRTTKNST